MADLNSQDLQESIDELQRSLNGLNGTVNNGNTAFQRELKNRGISADKAAAFGNTLDKLGSAATRVTGQLYKGEQGAKVFGDAMGDATDAVTQMAFAMGGPLVKALAVLGAGLVKYGRAAAEMSDTLFKSYQSISRTGAVGAQGLQGVFDQLQDFRLSLDDIGQLSDLFAQNSQALAMFRGTVFDGAKSLGALRKNITASGLEREFMYLGMNTQEINESMAGYVNTLVLTGRVQRMNTSQLVSGTEAYVKQMDELTKLTGVSRQQAESQIDANMRNERFAATVAKVRREQGDAAADNLERNMAYLSAAFPQTAEGLKDLQGGFITTDAARQAELAGFRDVTQLLTGDLGPALNAMSQASKRNTENFEGLAQVGVFGETFGAFNEQIKLAGLSAVDMANAQEKARREQGDQIKNAEAGVKSQVDLRISQMNSMQSMQAFIQLGVNPATQALAGLASVAETLASFLPGGKPVTGYGQGGTGTLGKSLASTAAGAAGGAALGSVVPGVGTVIGAGVGGLLGYLGYELGGGGTAGIDPNEVFNFTGNTGDLAHFNKLDPKVREAALQMAAEYLRMTGKKLQVNSAFRSLEEQANVQATGGAPKASPGASLHEQGRALDMNRDQTAYLEESGLLAKYGFKSGRAFNDPQHIHMRNGGIASGPKSGYAATLHGTEAVVPLPNGNAIPVDMSAGMSDGLGRQTDIMTQQLAKLEDLISVMRSQVSVSQQILQHTTN